MAEPRRPPARPLSEPGAPVAPAPLSGLALQASDPSPATLSAAGYVVVVLLLVAVAAAVGVPTLLRLRARRAQERRQAREARIAATDREEWRPEALAARVRSRFDDEIARRGGDPAEARLGPVEIVRIRRTEGGWGFTAHVAFAARLPRPDGRPARRPRRHAELWRCAPDGTPAAHAPARGDDPDLHGPAVPQED